MILSTSSQSLTIALGGAPATVNPSYEVNYTAGSNPNTTHGTLGSSTVTALAAPAGGVVTGIDTLNIANLDSASIVPTIAILDGGTSYTIWTGTLLVGETLFYTKAEGWKVMDSSGRIKGSSSLALQDGDNLALGTSVGTKLGTGTNQKLGFWNATPIVQPANSVDYVTGLVNAGLRASGGTASATFPGVVSGVGMVNSGVETNSIGASTAAAGTTNANAQGLPAGTAAVYPTTGADGTKGVIIDVADKVTGRTLFIGNGVSNQVLKVYPPSGGTINGASADVAFSSASGKGASIVCLSGAGNTWLAL